MQRPRTRRQQHAPLRAPRPHESPVPLLLTQEPLSVDRVIRTNSPQSTPSTSIFAFHLKPSRQTQIVSFNDLILSLNDSYMLLRSVVSMRQYKAYCSVGAWPLPWSCRLRKHFARKIASCWAPGSHRGTPRPGEPCIMQAAYVSRIGLRGGENMIFFKLLCSRI